MTARAFRVLLSAAWLLQMTVGCGTTSLDVPRDVAASRTPNTPGAPDAAIATPGVRYLRAPAFDDDPLEAWLLQVQSSDGSWSCDLGGASTEPEGPEREDATFEATCYAVLALTNSCQFESQLRSVRRGVAYLWPRRTGYDESAGGGGKQARLRRALRALAISQAYRRIGDPTWRPFLEWALYQIDKDLRGAGSPDGANCPHCASLVECATILALRSLRRAGLYVDPRWVDRASAFGHEYAARIIPHPEPRPREFLEEDVPAAYPVCPHGTSEMLGLACAVVAMDAADVPDSDPVLIAARRAVSEHLPFRGRQDGAIDHRYMLMGSWAMSRDAWLARGDWGDSVVLVQERWREYLGASTPANADSWSRACGPAAPIGCLLLSLEAWSMAFLVP